MCRDWCPPFPDESFYDWPIRGSRRCCVAGCCWPASAGQCPDCFATPCQRAAENPSSETHVIEEESSSAEISASLISARGLLDFYADPLEFLDHATAHRLAHVFLTVKCISDKGASRTGSGRLISSGCVRDTRDITKYRRFSRSCSLARDRWQRPVPCREIIKRVTSLAPGTLRGLSWSRRRTRCPATSICRARLRTRLVQCTRPDLIMDSRDHSSPLHESSYGSMAL